jgi:hypothetical protein
MVNLTILVNRQSILPRRAANNSRAALKAVTGARLWASGQAETPAVAAACSGSTPGYVRAAAVILKSEDEPLLDVVLRGEISLLKAAKQARRVANLINAYRNATRNDLVKVAKIVGCLVVPEAAYGTAAE